MAATVVARLWTDTPSASSSVSRTGHGASASGGNDQATGDERFELLDKALKRARFAQDQLIEILHVAQDVFGYLSEDVLVYVARALKLPPSRVYGVATFYHLFTFEEPGDHSCTVCTGTACFVKGADDIVLALSREHVTVAAGQTTEDGRFTLTTARCLGSCGLAPVVVLDGEVRGHLDAEAVLAAVARTSRPCRRPVATSDPPRIAEPAGVAGRALMAAPSISTTSPTSSSSPQPLRPPGALVCTSTGCLSAGAAPCAGDARDRPRRRPAADHDVQVVPTGCPGLCSRGPLVRVESRGRRADALRARRRRRGAFDRPRAPRRPGGRWRRRHRAPGHPVLRPQHQVVLANAGRIDPDRLEDYVAEGGYRALAKALRR
jgi:bidirectional [NiFe] hydrogenase diaphorase subunit